MLLNIGTKIRELRHRDGRTQEEFAAALYVTSQAVSRWEAGGSYPNIEIIPAIANYFHISIDELFGYHDDREIKIKSILDNATKILSHQGFTMNKGCLSDDVDECINMLREASEEFPNEPKILSKLAQALYMWGWHKYGAKGKEIDNNGIVEYDTEYNSQNIYWQEALAVYEKMLKLDLTSDERENVINQTTALYGRMGKYEKAKKLANSQNSIIICREMLLPMATIGEERMRYQDERLMEFLGGLEYSITTSIAMNTKVCWSEYGGKAIASVLNIYETIFADRRCGRYHWNIGCLYLTLCRYEIRNEGTVSDILAYFDKGFEHIKKYQEVASEEEYKYTAPLVASLKPIIKGELHSMDSDFWKNELANYPQDICEELRKNQKYAECFS